MRIFVKLLGAFAAAVAVTGALAAGWIWLQIGASAPIYDGTLAIAGLNAPVVVERDALGVVTIRSRGREDEARAFGFVHAEERFFQMDLLRRSAAGELSELFGAAALDFDEARRTHLLRATAEQVVAEAPPDVRRVLEAYAEGVNSGLKALDAKPFEYWLLGAEPIPWTAIDSVLAIGAMYFDLDNVAVRERNELVARSMLPRGLAEFMYPETTEWDAPLVGRSAAPARVPPAAVYDLRALPGAIVAAAGERRVLGERLVPGSNNWALAGAHTATGRALLASDMHLGLRVPSIWFRASLERGGRRVTGVSLPGLPLIAAGSNGDVAWSFTNSYGDWQDLIVVELHPDDPERYRTPDGWRDFERVSSSIDVAGGEPRELTIRRTIWGPVVGELPDGTPLALRWVAHDPRGYAPGFFALAEATNVAEALDAAARSGIPPQNFVVADADGRIAWTIIGQMPRRVAHGFASLSGQGPAWDGWLEPDEYPRVVAPASGRIWTANARVVDGAMLAKIGDGGYDLGARAAQIRDRLLAIERAAPADMLRVQLDDEALFLARWRERLLVRLAGRSNPLHAAARKAVQSWGGRAAVDSAGYRIVRGWRLELIDSMAAAIFAEVRAADPGWTYDSLRAEQWAWALVSEQPRHLLDPRVETWAELELAALDEFLEDELGIAAPAELVERTWGERNTVRVGHPLSQAAPFLGRWLDMPSVAMPGDTHMPRVQGPGFGATERFAVTPGDEANGYFHMPGGQSGHPRSPFYGAGHDDWVAGRPTPFLPGPPVRSLTLEPPPSP